MAYPLAQLMGPHAVASATRVRAYVQMAEAVEYLRRQHVTHRDIKPDNILLDEQGNAYIADMGIGRQQTGTFTHVMAGAAAFGTQGYMAPELALAGDDADWQRLVEVSFAVDMWSLGCTILAVETGVWPYAGVRLPEVIRRMKRGVELARAGQHLDAAAAAELLACLPFSADAIAAVRPTQLAETVLVSLTW
jgi:serine/threonine protein kinase